MKLSIAELEQRFTVRLREERERLHLSQLELSNTAGLSQNLVNFIETGKRTPTLRTILKLADAMQVNPAVFFMNRDEDREKAKMELIELINRYF